MSEKIRELIEIPQQFAKEGKQVRSALSMALKWAYGFLAVHYPMHKTISDWFVVILNVTTVMRLKSVSCMQSSFLYAEQWESGSR